MRKNVVKDERLMLRACELYYNENLSQAEIGKQLGLSRPTISRLLSSARDEGIVTITISSKAGRKYYKLEQKIEDLFGLKEVYITDNGINGNSIEEVGKATANLLTRVIKQDSIVGVSLGTTLSQIAPNLEENFMPATRFIPLVGGMGIIPQEIHGNTLIENISKKFCGTHYPFYSPARIENEELLKELMKEKTIEYVFNLSKKMDIAILGLGSSENSTLLATGYIMEEEQRQLIINGMVGDLCMQYYNINGDTDIFPLNKQVLGINLDILRDIDWSIGVCFGKKKVDSIIGAINGGYINSLVTDYQTAENLIKKSMEYQETETKN